MIELLCAKLQALGLMRAGARVQSNATIKLDNVLIDLFDDRGHYFYARVAELYDLEPEYRIAETVASHLGRFVPRPLAFFREQGLSCIVFEGLEFDVVSGADLLGAAPKSPVARGLLDFLRGSTAALRGPPDPASFAKLLTDVDARFTGTEQESLWRDVRAATDVAHLASLPNQRQHGDFVPNNFGVCASGLLVFDWEDFGKVNLPGFDLAVLLASCVDFDPEELRRIRAPLANDLEARVEWLPEAFQVLGLEASRFWRCVPFHLIAFLCLKDRYSPAIRAKVVHAIEGLL